MRVDGKPKVVAANGGNGQRMERMAGGTAAQKNN
jgi:hypothetical protein